MKRKFIRERKGPKHFVAAIFFASIALLALGGLVMLLWNAVLPPLLHVSSISFWQAVGLFVLCKILFSPLRPGGRRHAVGPPGPLKEKLMNMSEEEKTAFREKWQNRFNEPNE